MIDDNKFQSAMRAIQGVMIVARSMTYRAATHDRIARLLDHGEYLPGLILDPTDRTADFESYLSGIADDFAEARWIVDEYFQSAGLPAPPV